MIFILNLLLVILSCLSCRPSGFGESTIDGNFTDTKAIEEIPFEYIINLPNGGESTMNIATGISDLELKSDCNFSDNFDFFVNDRFIDVVTCNEKKYSLLVDSSLLQEGFNDIKFSINKNNSSFETNYLVLVDTIRPSLTIDSVPTIIKSNQESYSLQGSCTENNQEVIIAISTLIETTTCNNGTWNISINLTDLSDDPAVPISVNHVDSASNNALEVSANALKDTIRPTVNITSAFNITPANQHNYLVIGDCNENSRPIAVIIGSQIFTTICNSGSWTTGYIDISAQSDNPNFLISAQTTDFAGNTSEEAIKTVSKTSSIPTVSFINTPAINQTNVTSYNMYGKCSNTGSIVSVNLGGIIFLPNCSSGNWSITNVDVSSLPDSSAINLTANHLSSNQIVTTISKNTSLPTVTISSSPQINFLNQSNYTISGTCSESSRQVLVDFNEGGLLLSLSCISNTWTSGIINVSTLPEGIITIKVDHSNSGGISSTQAQVSINKSTSSPSISNLSAPTTLSSSVHLSWLLVSPDGTTINDYIIPIAFKKLAHIGPIS